MKIVIPMSGLGKRFADAGYTDIKPLIKVHDKPIIEWVHSMFPGENDFIFICRQEHLENTNLRNELMRICPSGVIVGIEGHKFGPVYAVSQVFDLLDDNDEIIVNYCDFYQDWDYSDFKKTIQERGSAGSIPCYTGFHPHLLIKENFYASCLRDVNENLIEIKEKYSFEKDKTKAFHSGGTYYFASGAIVKKYFNQLMNGNHHLNGEFYISLVYNLMCRDGLETHVYDRVTQFCQWGTPRDLEDYLRWHEIIKHYQTRNI